MNALMTLLLAVNAAAQTPAAAPAKAEAPKVDAAKLYAGKCSSCHGKDGKGSAAMAKMFKADPAEMNLTSEGAAKTSDADLTKVMVEGRNKMPAFKGKLKDEEISALVAFIRGLAPKPEAAKAAEAPKAPEAPKAAK